MLGAGSNTLISDEGIDGLVIATTIAAFAWSMNGPSSSVRAAYAARGTGLRNARPRGRRVRYRCAGTLGASVYGNAGAFGTEMADVLVDCTSLDPHGEPLTLTAAECDFGYRRSRFKEDLSGNVVVSARVRVHADDPGRVRERTEAIQAQRKASQPYGIAAWAAFSRIRRMTGPGA